MNYYRFTYPEYKTDIAHSRNNPVEWANQYIVPGVICPVCGPWGGVRHLLLPIEDPKLKKRLNKTPYPLPLDEWNKLVKDIVKSFGAISACHLQPGDELGKPRVKITSIRVSDFIFPWTGGILITEKTRGIIEGSKLTGYQFDKVELIDGRRNKTYEQPLPTIYVLIVTGRIKPPSNVDRCPICGRFRANYSIELGVDNWDGNDFFMDENYPELIFVTEQVCSLFKEKGLQNYQCNPVYSYSQWMNGP